MQQQTLYRSANEHDACGVGLLVNINGTKSHNLVEKGLQVLEHMTHRGAEGADPDTGDGAGMMIQIPHEFILLQGVPVPEKGRYGSGMVFLPRNPEAAERMLDIIEHTVIESGLGYLPPRRVPTDNSMLGPVALAAEPDIRQIFVTDEESNEPIEPKLYALRRKIEKRIAESSIPDRRQFYIVSLSSTTIVYKGMLSSGQLRHYYPDLMNPRLTTAMALVHSRFSTNTFPSWALAQPFRLLGHNGEINTIRGNRRWVRARESVMSSPAFAGADVSPILQPDMSDSASLDNFLEYLVMGGLSLPHALAMLVPESYNDKNPIPVDLRAFYEYHSILTEPWDGPAALLFCDGRFAGGMLDRNGLRPARYVITRSGTMVIASEAGVLTFDAAEVQERGQLKPGKILLVDMHNGRLYYDPEIKEKLASAHPYRKWLESNRVVIDSISTGRKVSVTLPEMRRLQHLYGYHADEVKSMLLPMINEGKEPINSMGNDTPAAVFSSRVHPLFDYFRQNFAQVTNPPIDPLREELVMSLDTYIGDVGSGFFDFSADKCKMVQIKRPVLTNRELDILCNLRYKGFVTRKLPMTFPAADGAEGMRRGIDRLCTEAEKAVDDGCNYIILSDRDVDANNAPIPSLLATSAVHHHLIECKKRVQTALIIETAEAREVMHFALLSGYGASAVNPYLAFAMIDGMVREHSVQLDFEKAQSNYIKAIDKGLLKILSKMGISTLASYQGAQLFESVGLSEELLNRYFGESFSAIGGMTLEDICRDTLLLHSGAFSPEFDENSPLLNHGQYAWRKGGDPHAWNPTAVRALQEAVRRNDFQKFMHFCQIVDQKEEPIFVRDFLDYNYADVATPLEEVESEADIMSRFVSGAMSFGSISREAHEIIARAMNQIGGKSNTGEGGEEPARFIPAPDGSSTRSAIKQIASGRFGVTTEYLVNADEIQIKVAQGAKPGEGGQLPGFKVDEVIARTRHSLPGLSLISPPPHHDIYSIEDLAQLIFDLGNVNPTAKISVKLVSENGVGTIAAGVAKAKSDTIIISGGEGGTGASPAGSIRYAGLPAELGLAETQQTLVLNGLRGQVTLQVDGQIKSARDVIIMAMLGAEEFGFSTAVLISLGCMMLRQCHLNTCPMGVATQNLALRARFKGRVEHVVNYFTFLARAIRLELSRLGVRSLSEITGRADMLHERNDVKSPRTTGLDFSSLLAVPHVANASLHHTHDHVRDTSAVLDHQIISRAGYAIDHLSPIELHFPICNTDRATGAMLSGHIARLYGDKGLPDDTVNVTFTGSAGQSFGAFLSRGITFRLEGEANDYVAKGLCGGRISIVPADGTTYDPARNAIAGNTLLYGATAGELYINGCVGERFAVRNSGAVAVVEGVGDHCCEYMTGGRVVVLGPTGRNFAAGMSGGIAYVWNPNGNFDYFCNMEMVEISLVESLDDRRELHRLISSHFRYTRSPLAAQMLEQWDNYVCRFIKVIPYDYRLLLEKNSHHGTD